MNEWTLPATAAARYADLVAREKTSGRYEEHKANIRGGIWKNFFTRYPESNWMHKRMQALSLRVAALPDGKCSADLLDDLYEAQANDAYWHGLFGGLYLPHLRRAVYNAIVRLEAKLDQLIPRAVPAQSDYDLDGIEEYAIYNNSLQAIIKLDGHAGICELDDYRLNHNFGDTLRRQAEHYFAKIKQSQESSEHAGEGIANPHERVSFKHEISHSDLLTDLTPQGLFTETLQTELGSVAVNNYVLVQSDEDELQFQATLAAGVLRKVLQLTDNCIEARYSSHGLHATDISVRLYFAMPSCDGYMGRFIGADNIILGGLGQPLLLNDALSLILDDGVLGGHIVLTASHRMTLNAQPYFSVSQSEAGFEKIMQAVEITVTFPISAELFSLSVEVNQGQKQV